VYGSDISLLAAFGAGVVAFISPCVLPMMPVYIALLAGSGSDDGAKAGRLAINGVCFMAGFTLVFLLMGATASALGQLFLDYQDVVRKTGAVFMVIMGGYLTGIFRMPFLNREYWRPQVKKAAGGPLGALLLGMAVTAGWTPCTGPILASVLAYAGASDTAMRGVWLLLAYSAGFALPFVLMALLCRHCFDRVRLLYRWLPVVQKAAGGVLVASGVLLYLNWFKKGLALLLTWWT